MFGWLFGRRRRDEELMVSMVRAAAEGHQVRKLRQAMATISAEPINGKDSTEDSAIAAALLTKAIAGEAIGVIDDDDDVFVAGIFAFVLSNYFSYVTAGNFELASTLAVMRLLGPDEFRRSFDTIRDSHNEMVEGKSKVLEAIGKSCEGWFGEPSQQRFNRLTELFVLLRESAVVR